MAQDTQPETPTEGGRVFREFPVGRIKGESAVGPAGYQNANEIRKQVENSVDADAFGQLADAGTIRKDFGESIEANSVHGSDSPENAAKEVYFFFSDCDLVG